MNFGSDFSVPTLSLTSSRSKRQHATVVPTRDYSSLASNTRSSNQNDANLDNKYSPTISNNPYVGAEKQRRPHIFPPKPPQNTIGSNEAFSQGNETSNRDLNKNVYLQLREEAEEPQIRNYLAEANELAAREFSRGNSSRRLLANPMSSRVVQDQMAERNTGRKAEIGKVLFERRLSKLMEEAEGCQRELEAAGKDEFSLHITELQRIREQSISSHRDLLSGLQALIR